MGSEISGQGTFSLRNLFRFKNTTPRSGRSGQDQLAWVYRKGQVKSGTIMRGFQLSNIARSRLSNVQAISYIELTEAIQTSSSTLFLTPSVTKHATRDELEKLRKRRNTICFDFLDYPPNDQLIDDRDILISSSIRQHEYFTRQYPKNIAHMVTHHVDPEIDFPPRKFDEAKIGYFGELGNARYRSQIAHRVAFHQTNNSENFDRSWLRKLPEYNCHYSVREYVYPFRNPPPNAFKPFTKGFTAARCSANLIVDSEESDAVFYLGADYPYLLADKNLSTVSAALEFVKESFGSREWRFALEVMREVEAKSSPTHITEELRELLRIVRSK